MIAKVPTVEMFTTMSFSEDDCTDFSSRLHDTFRARKRNPERIHGTWRQWTDLTLAGGIPGGVWCQVPFTAAGLS
jgi:hypothetical protein